MTLREELFKITDVLRNNPNYIVQEDVVSNIMEIILKQLQEAATTNPHSGKTTEEKTP